MQRGQLRILRGDPDVEPGETALADRSDDELMLLARGGVRLAFDALVRRHQGRALRIATRFLGDPSLAKDVTQNTFVHIYGSLPRYRAEHKFAAYLHSILLGQCKMARRSSDRYRRRLHQLQELPPQTAGAGSADAVIAREKQRELDAALQRLSDKLRAVIVLRFSADCSYQEIADALDLPLGTVKSRLFCGLEQLKAAMEGHER